MSSANALGEYLKLRRGQVLPEDVGLVPGPRRKVAGLRREELAALAGMSADYYLRIEQGRVTNPSPQILDALARALRLDIPGTAHLHRLAHDRPRAYTDAEVVSDDILILVDQLTLPAFVLGRCQDCLASNALAQALSPNFRVGQSLVRQLFLDPAERRLHVDWDEITSIAVGGLRQIAAGETYDPRLDTLVAELCSSSQRFRELWTRADVGYRRTGPGRHLNHPRVGDLRLLSNLFPIPDSDGQLLQIFHPAPGTDTADKLALLIASST